MKRVFGNNGNVVCAAALFFRRIVKAYLLATLDIYSGIGEYFVFYVLRTNLMPFVFFCGWDKVRAIRSSAAGKRATADSLEQQARDATKQLELQKAKAEDLEQELRQRHEHSQVCM